MFAFTSSHNSPARRRRLTAALAVAATLTMALSACGSGSGTGANGGNPNSPNGTDDGTTLTMWTRAATQTQSQEFVKQYNASHKNQVKLTVIPTDDYQAKIGAAAGSKSLPDLFASDVVFAPNYTSSGLYLDITDRINSLPFAKDLAQSHIKTGTFEGKEYVVPHTMDLSVLFYNKDLYTKAGLDPEKPPTTLQEFADQARAVNKLGGDTHGTFFGGNCGGCLVFTWWPTIWADGEQAMNDAGTASELASPEAQSVYKIYRGLVDDGIVAPGTKDETGATWTGVFPKGNIGIMPMPSTTLGSMPADLNIGVAAIPGVKGGESTFVGGDSIGIAATSKHADQAWNFLAWSLGDDAQINVLAKNHDVIARSDLASNKYSESDPRLVKINEIAAKGTTPFSLKFGEAFNDPNGPWLVLIRDQIFGDQGKLAADNKALDAVLGAK